MSDVRPDSPEVVVLLERLRGGDPSALDELLALHRDALRRFIDCRHDGRVRARLDASDVVQEAQLEIARRIRDYLERRPMPFHLWVCKTAHEQLLRLRRQHRAARRTVDREGPLPEHSSILLARELLGPPSPSLRLREEERALRLQEALACLDEADREVLLLRTFEKLNNAEVAEMLGIQPDAASKRYGRALLRLRKALADAGLTDAGS